MVETFQIKEKAEKRMMKLNPFKDQYIDVSERKPIQQPQKKSIAEIKDKYKIKSEVVRSYGTTEYMPSSKAVMKSWFPKKPIGVSVRSMVEKGQTVQELLAKIVAYSSNHKSKIIAWKFDEDFKGFIIKRINGSCEVYYFLTYIAKLDQQYLKELRSLSLKSQEYKKKKTPFVPGLVRQFMLDDIANYIPKLEQQGVKVFKGDQNSYPILRWFYDTRNKELVLVRNVEDYSEDEIRMFGVFELRLLHPSYIHFLAKQKFEKMVGQDSVQDLCYFIHMIEILSVAYEKMALRKELLVLNVRTLKITNIQSLEINNRRNLVIKSASRVDEMFTKDDILNLAQETIEEMMLMPIIVKNDKHAKAASKFQQYIKSAQDFWKVKPLSEFVEVKEEKEET
ncbi:hypothetical protein QVD17_16746 [Tagetes erecta]|uniref:Uncharacterized protein n=1 Tax=Tagetes erecta TaxID=13708 RepID=A0AAD8P0T7_TARER|nr:hypothetical protein QVD17_16746 [Tagetes erecta]